MQLQGLSSPFLTTKEGARGKEPIVNVAPIVLIVVLSLVAAHGTASAADGIPDALDDVIELVKEIATALVRLLIAVGAGLFILGVVRGAFDGLLGTTLGNTFTSTDGVYRAIGALVAFADICSPQWPSPLTLLSLSPTVSSMPTPCPYRSSKCPQEQRFLLRRRLKRRFSLTRFRM